MTNTILIIRTIIPHILILIVLRLIIQISADVRIKLAEICEVIQMTILTLILIMMIITIIINIIVTHYI